MNLKGHIVATRAGQEHLLYTASDVEIHQVNGEFYALDFARLMPPEAPFDKPGYFTFSLFFFCFSPSKSKPKMKRNCIWYQLLRPEFVKQYKKPLSSDAFSAFGRIGRQEHNKEVEEATKELAKAAVEGAKKLIYPMRAHRSLVRALHINGTKMTMAKISKLKCFNCW
jgi:hypothetical protein